MDEIITKLDAVMKFHSSQYGATMVTYTTDSIIEVVQALAGHAYSLTRRVQELERARDADANYRQEQNERT